MRKSLLLALFVFLTLSLTACVSLAEDVTPPPGYQAPTVAQSTAQPGGPVYPIVAPDPGKGEALYITECAPCHGIGGLGDGSEAGKLPVPVPPLGDPALARQAVPSDWYQMVTNGNLQRMMPPFKSLSASQRWDVIAYAFTLSMPEEALSQGKQIYIEDCAACHGETGQGDGSQAATLADSPVDFTDQAFMGARSQADLYAAVTSGSGGMHAFSDFSEDQVWSLVSHLRSLTFVELINADVSTAIETPEPTAGLPATLDEPTPVIPSELSPDGVGTVRVEVLHGIGGELPDNLKVVLRGFDGMTEVFSNSMSLTDEPVAVFENIVLPPDRVFFATIEHENALYGSDIAQILVGTDLVNLQITYYEPTTDASILSADRLHVLFDFLSTDLLQAYVIYIFSNDTDKVVVPDGDQPTLSFTLPEGATDMRVQESMQLVYVETLDGFGITSIYPSTETYQVLYSFTLPYQRNKAEIELPIAMDTAASIVMVPADGVRLRSEQLQESGARDMQGVSYNIFNGAALQAGDRLRFSLSGQPKNGTELITALGDEGHLGLVIGLAVFGVALIGVGLYLWRRSRLTEEEYAELEQELDDAPEMASDPDVLMDEIITLDDLYQAGELSEDAYQQRRAELKARLEQVLGTE